MMAGIARWRQDGSNRHIAPDGGMFSSPCIPANMVCSPAGFAIYAGYDGLNRQTWRNSSNTSSGAYVLYSYDDNSGSNQGLGRLTGETFKGADASDSSLSGSYSYHYDVRGQRTSSTSVLLGASYTSSSSYDDAGDPTALTYPDGSVTTSSYDATGWFDGLTRTQGGAASTLLNAVSYTGADGAWGTITSATLSDATSGSNALYHYGAHDDSLGRPTESNVVRLSDSATLFEEQLSYDPAGNVSALSTELPAGTDHQLFCYDEQNRLTWAGTTTSNPCGNSGTTGTFSGVGYSQSYSYDTLDRLTSGTLGSYTYGDANHLHAATQVGSGSTAYTASYDAAGDMTCRAPDGSATCTGSSPTGQPLTWDTEGRLAAWQNTPTSPTSTATYLYDGEGNRVAQVATNGSGTTTTTYVGSLAEVSVTGGTTTTTDYYYAAGKLLAEAVNGSLSYLVTNAQGTPLESLDTSGNITASRLYSPYGGMRYRSGSFATRLGYTGQRNDTNTNLDYYGARYYDPTLGQFTSADTWLAGGLNRYGYVGGNPTSATDPSGHYLDPTAGDSGGEMGAVITAPGPGDTSTDTGTTGTGGSNGPAYEPPGGSTPEQPFVRTYPVWGASATYADGTGGVVYQAEHVDDGTPIYNRQTAYQTFATWHGPQGDDGTPIYNAGSAPKGTPASPATTPSQPGSGGGGPKTQPGGGGAGAGAPPSGGGGPPSVVSPPPADDSDCGCGDVVDVYLSMGKYPETAQHILDAISAGQPDILTLNRGLASANRAASLRGIPTKPGFDRDEYPMAATQEGVAGADIRYVTSADNQGAGSSIGNQLRPYDDGQRFRIVVCP